MDNYMGHYGGYYGYGLDPTYILVIIAAVFSLVCSAMVKSTFKKYSKVIASSNMTGAEVAAQILHKEGIYDVKVGHISGELTDHFNPAAKVVNLSDSVYSSRSVAAIGVAAHECGHAMQHNEEYFPLKVRSALVPVANFGSKYGMYIIIAGFIISFFRPLITIGILLFSFGVAFQIVTLPVEFDASRRALAVLEEMGIVTGSELEGSRKVLKSAAMTYVAAAAGSILTLIRLILIYGGRGKKRD